MLSYTPYECLQLRIVFFQTGECVVQLHAKHEAIPGVRHKLLRVGSVDGGLCHVRHPDHVRHMEVRHQHHFNVALQQRTILLC